MNALFQTAASALLRLTIHTRDVVEACLDRVQSLLPTQTGIVSDHRVLRDDYCECFWRFLSSWSNGRCRVRSFRCCRFCQGYIQEDDRRVLCRSPRSSGTDYGSHVHRSLCSGAFQVFRSGFSLPTRRRILGCDDDRVFVMTLTPSLGLSNRKISCDSNGDLVRRQFSQYRNRIDSSSRPYRPSYVLWRPRIADGIDAQ
jgi:hypothetical protein